MVKVMNKFYSDFKYIGE